MMRVWKASFIVGFALIGSSAAFGCQFVAGIAGLEATGSCELDDCAPYACNTAGTACNTTCGSASGGCAEDAFCDEPPGAMAGKCESCGWLPTSGSCEAANCEACGGSMCTTTCDAPGECTQGLTLETKNGITARLLCLDRCNDIMITCSGASPCEVVCEAGGCQNLILQCDRIGMCKLTCNGASCAGASVNCGGNACTASCENPNMVKQTCGESCDCTKPGCL